MLRHVSGWGVGCVNVHVNLRHMHMLRHVLGWGVGCVNVHFNLRHMHMLRHVLGWGVGGVNVHVNLRRMHMLRHVLGCGVGCVNVHVNLRHMHMLRHVLGWGVGCVNVHVNLRHMRMLRHVWVSPCWYHNCRMRADVETDVKQEQDLVTCRRSFMLWFAFHTIRALCFIKSGIPCSLATRVNSHVNPKLMRSIRVRQWRWMNSKSTNYLDATGRSLKMRMAMWEEENIAHVFSRANFL